MTSEDRQDDSDLFGDLLPKTSLDASHGQQITVFKPWHLPRKQHVRKAQWVAAAAKLLGELEHEHVLRYLCLPGEDLIDIEALADLCISSGKKLRYLGFDLSAKSAEQSSQRVIAKQILAQKGSVVSESDVVPDDFSSLANAKGQGWKSFLGCGSYDILNLDLCDSFTSTSSPLHEALGRVLEHQLKSRGLPWLLFLTARAEFQNVASSEQTAYLNLLKENVDISDEFKTSIASLVGNPDPLSADFLDKCQGDHSVSGRVLSLSIGKWLANLSHEQWRVDMLSIWSYRTGIVSSRAEKFSAEPPNLYSLVFKFTKLNRARQDRTGLTKPIVGSGEVTEIQLAEKMLKCILAHHVDLDQHLASNISLAEELVEETVAHLKSRNYSEDAYRQWFNATKALKFDEIELTAEDATLGAT